jgi:hypothetical protein
MITSHATFVLLAERRSPRRPSGLEPPTTRRIERLRSKVRAILGVTRGFRPDPGPLSVARTDVDPAPARSS